MGESIYPVPEEWAQSALIDNEGYPAMYRQSIENPEAFWAEEASASTGSALSPRPRKPLSQGRFRHQVVCRRHAQPVANALDRHLAAARPDRHPVGPTAPRKPTAASPIANCTSRSAASPMC
jgi:acetyl-CoA synthetase